MLGYFKPMMAELQLKILSEFGNVVVAAP